jgi:hypothetical protein
MASSTTTVDIFGEESEEELHPSPASSRANQRETKNHVELKMEVNGSV